MLVRHGWSKQGHLSCSPPITMTQQRQAAELQGALDMQTLNKGQARGSGILKLLCLVSRASEGLWASSRARNKVELSALPLMEAFSFSMEEAPKNPSYWGMKCHEPQPLPALFQWVQTWSAITKLFLLQSHLIFPSYPLFWMTENDTFLEHDWFLLMFTKPP